MSTILMLMILISFLNDPNVTMCRTNVLVHFAHSIFNIVKVKCYAAPNKYKKKLGIRINGCVNAAHTIASSAFCFRIHSIWLWWMAAQATEWKWMMLLYVCNMLWPGQLSYAATFGLVGVLPCQQLQASRTRSIQVKAKTKTVSRTIVFARHTFNVTATT